MVQPVDRCLKPLRSELQDLLTVIAGRTGVASEVPTIGGFVALDLSGDVTAQVLPYETQRVDATERGGLANVSKTVWGVRASGVARRRASGLSVVRGPAKDRAEGGRIQYGVQPAVELLEGSSGDVRLDLVRQGAEAALE